MLVLTRQKLPVLDRKELAAAEGVKRGAYVLMDPTGTGGLDAVLIGTGSELGVAIGAARLLQADGVRARDHHEHLDRAVDGRVVPRPVR